MTKAKKSTTTKRKAAAKKKIMLPWAYKEEINAEEFIRRVADMALEPLNSMENMEGDMYMSDFRELMTLKWKLYHALQRLDGKY